MHRRPMDFPQKASVLRQVSVGYVLSRVMINWNENQMQNHNKNACIFML